MVQIEPDFELRYFGVCGCMDVYMYVSSVQVERGFFVVFQYQKSGNCAIKKDLPVRMINTHA